MTPPPTNFQSFFRSEAWVQAWIDVWGKHPAIELIDLGGSGKPLEHLYRIKHRIKHLLPARTLNLAGTGFGEFSTPRAEYNDINALVAAAGGLKELAKELDAVRWDQWHLPDIVGAGNTFGQIQSLAKEQHWPINIERVEPAYSIQNMDFNDYLRSLSGSTRRIYFNQRTKLEARGRVERKTYFLEDAHRFLDELNAFHLQRWGRPCYASDSTRFIQNFLERFVAEGGEPVLDAITVDGKPISLLFDIIWKQTRHNLQSGYLENDLPGLSVGALHFGYAIEDALAAGRSYDLLAGTGKHTDYKARVANRTTGLKSIIIQKPWIARLRKLHGFLPFGTSVENE